MGKKQGRPRPGQRPRAEDAHRHPPTPPPKVAVSFEKYVCGGDYCLSLCSGEQIRSFLECLRKLSGRTWQQLIEGSSKDGSLRTGLNSTTYDKNSLKNPDLWPDWLSQDKTLVGVRATIRRRVFGVRDGHVFYVIWFDEKHEIVGG